ncbi:MAG: HAMP domain-containing protein, partial [Leptolyngbyaceae cyanobacterium CAN_BIN12]|nr:HAMP domain-containing protein [Leptolyngbyaceae cyanobacterium CAN_BIN12]
MSKMSMHWLSRLPVGQKIGVGYVLALGVAASGAIAGFSIGNHYQNQAVHQEEHTQEELSLLRHLQTGILQSRTHQQQLIPLAKAPKDFDAEYAHISKHRQEIERVVVKLDRFLAVQSMWANHAHHQKIVDFLQTSQAVPERYLQELDRLVQEIRKLNLTSSDGTAQAQKLLLDFTNSELALKFDGISDGLVGLIEQSNKEAVTAEEVSHQSHDLAEKIVLGSIGLSVAIASLLAMLTSRAIARPIRALTQIAQRSTRESNFDLQAPVNSDDEIGSLATSFNQLIHSTKQLLGQQQIDNQQLAEYSQTLESRVKERTQELGNKNSQLQELLEKLHQSQVQIVQSEKMSSLGQLVAGIAHEINNPVNFIYGNLTHVQDYAHNLLDYVQLYQKHYPSPPTEIVREAEEIDLEFLQEDLPKLLSSMQIGTDRIRQIVLSLRNFSRMDEADFKAIDIHEGLDSTLLILQHRLKARPESPEIEVLKDYGTLPLVECYAGQLNQVFMNILANAIDALDELNAKRTHQERKDNP